MSTDSIEPAVIEPVERLLGQPAVGRPDDGVPQRVEAKGARECLAQPARQRVERRRGGRMLAATRHPPPGAPDRPARRGRAIQDTSSSGVTPADRRRPASPRVRPIALGRASHGRNLTRPTRWPRRSSAPVIRRPPASSDLLEQQPSVADHQGESGTVRHHGRPGGVSPAGGATSGRTRQSVRRPAGVSTNEPGQGWNARTCRSSSAA